MKPTTSQPTITMEEYFQLADQIEIYLKKATDKGGFHTLSDAENAELKRISELVSQYEKDIKVVPLDAPLTLPEMLRLKMFQKRLTQRQTAELLEITPSRVSEIMNGKISISLKVAKQMYLKLGIPADFILQNA